ncbi:hypothetical protein B0H10DRAFT_2190780 [Mycena sp. CBHHK59/15]|nr:hypothetical protein B0H10DRAFT_2190780 [Mycena sp. CBHHK59/15]
MCHICPQIPYVSHSTSTTPSSACSSQLFRLLPPRTQRKRASDHETYYSNPQYHRGGVYQFPHLPMGTKVLSANDVVSPTYRDDLLRCEVTRVEHYREKGRKIAHELIIVYIRSGDDTRILRMERFKPSVTTDTSAAASDQVRREVCGKDTNNLGHIKIADTLASVVGEARGYSLVQSINLPQHGMGILDVAALTLTIHDIARTAVSSTICACGGHRASSVLSSVNSLPVEPGPELGEAGEQALRESILDDYREANKNLTSMEQIEATFRLMKDAALQALESAVSRWIERENAFSLRDAANAELDAANTELDAANAELDAVNAELDAANAERDALKRLAQLQAVMGLGAQ